MVYFFIYFRIWVDRAYHYKEMVTLFYNLI